MSRGLAPSTEPLLCVCVCVKIICRDFLESLGSRVVRRRAVSLSRPAGCRARAALRARARTASRTPPVDPMAGPKTTFPHFLSRNPAFWPERHQKAAGQRRKAQQKAARHARYEVEFFTVLSALSAVLSLRVPT